MRASLDAVPDWCNQPATEPEPKLTDHALVLALIKRAMSNLEEGWVSAAEDALGRAKEVVEEIVRGNTTS